MSVALVRFEAPAVVVVMAVFQPFRTDLIHKVAYHPIGVAVLHHPEIAVDAVEKMSEHRGIGKPVPPA